jgi:hypothetical protein
MNRRHRRPAARQNLPFRLPLGSVIVLLVGATLWLGALPRMHADEAHRSKIYDSRGFEPMPFVTGEELLGVDGWSTAIPPFLNPAAAKITAAESSTGRRSVEVWGGDLADSEGITAPYDAVGSYRRPLSYSVTLAKPIVVIEADLLLETDQAATDDDFFSMTIAARSGDGETLGEIGLASSGWAVAYDFDASAGDDAMFAEPIEFNAWHHVSIEMDFSGEKTLVSYYLDGEFLGELATESTSDVLLRGAMVVYALPDDEFAARDDYTARFDNFQVSVHTARD